MPFFSIILPTYNRAHLLPKAIESVMTQVFEDWELVIVDDGSTDDTKELINSYSDSRIRYIYQTNQERSAARNKGIEIAFGNYICFLDSDDYFLPEKLMVLYNFINESTIKDAVFYDGIIFENTSKFKQLDLPIKRVDETVFEFLLFNPLGSLQICAKRETFLTGKFNPIFRIGEDVELWLRLAEKLPFIPIQNAYNTIAVEHDERSVNLKRTNSALDQKKTIEYIFKETGAFPKFRKITRKRVISNCYFNIAKFHMYNNARLAAIKWIIRSFVSNLKNEQSKHRIYCFLKLTIGQIPTEYIKKNETPII